MPFGTDGVPVTAAQLPEYTKEHCVGASCRICTPAGVCACVDHALTEGEVRALFPFDHEDLFVVKKLGKG